MVGERNALFKKSSLALWGCGWALGWPKRRQQTFNFMLWQKGKVSHVGLEVVLTCGIPRPSCLFPFSSLHLHSHAYHCGSLSIWVHPWICPSELWASPWPSLSWKKTDELVIKGSTNQNFPEERGGGGYAEHPWENKNAWPKVYIWSTSSYLQWANSLIF